MEAFAEYGHALASIAIWAIVVMILGPFSAAKKPGAGLVPGETPQADYANPLFRFERAHINTAETLAVFVAVVVAAMLAGVSSFWVNWLASLSLLCRLVMIFIHIKGIGRPAQGPRTALFVLSWAMHVALAVMTLVAVF